MVNAEGRVETDRASRYLVQLGRHTGKMGHQGGHRPRAHHGGDTPPTVEHTEWSDTEGTITFAWGQCTLQATPDALTLRAEATDEEHLRRIQDGISRRVEMIGRRDGLKVAWHRPGAPQEKPGEVTGPAPASGDRAAERRRRLQTIGLIAAGGLVLVMHLGAFGAVLAASKWTEGVTKVVLVLILLKVVTLAAHGVLGGWAIRRRKRNATPVNPAVPDRLSDAEPGRAAAESSDRT